MQMNFRQVAAACKIPVLLDKIIEAGKCPWNRTEQSTISANTIEGPGNRVQIPFRNSNAMPDIGFWAAAWSHADHHLVRLCVSIFMQFTVSRSFSKIFRLQIFYFTSLSILPLR